MSVLSVQFYFLRKSPYIHIIDKDYLKILIVLIVAIFGMMISINLIISRIVFIRLMSSSVIFFGLYFVGLLMVKEDIIEEHGISIITKLLKKK